jgi:cold shock CspA family protein
MAQLQQNQVPSPFNPVMTQTPTRVYGRIRRIKQAFGFIAGDDGVDYFFHRYGFRKDSPKQFSECKEQDRLEFTPCQPPADPTNSKEKGPRAIEVMYVEG